MERLSKKDREYTLTFAIALALLVFDGGAILWRGEYFSAGFFALLGAVGAYHVTRIRAIDAEAGKLAADLLVGLAIVGSLSLGG